MAPEILADECMEYDVESVDGLLPNDIEVSVILQTKNRPTESQAFGSTLGLDFEGMKAADVYAFGLVLWEIFRRCLTDEG